MSSATIKQHHIEGRFTLFDGTYGSRKNPVESGYRPQHKVHDNYQTSGRHEYPDVEQLSPGASTKVHVWFITPEVYPGCLWIGREIEVLEGSRVVGKLLVTRIVDPQLEGSAESYKPLWIAPP
jgi:translation elongation factor EF-Tu-like GTPase